MNVNLYVTLVGLCLIAASLTFGVPALVRRNWGLLTLCGVGSFFGFLSLWVA